MKTWTFAQSFLELSRRICPFHHYHKVRMKISSIKLLVSLCCAVVIFIIVTSIFQHKNNRIVLECFGSQMNRSKDKRPVNEVTNGIYIPCLGLQMNRANETQVIPMSFINEVKMLRDFLAERGAHVILNGGSLLGWYRDCSIIPHTTDFDLAIRAEEYSDEMVQDLDADDSPFHLYRIYGTPCDFLELGVTRKNIGIDIFFLYTESNHSWVGGLDWETRQKYKWTYPRIENLCYGSLYGWLFLVPCNVEEVLQHEYGDWRNDHDSSNFSWTSSHRNVQKNAVYTPEQMTKMRKESMSGDIERESLFAFTIVILFLQFR